MIKSRNSELEDKISIRNGVNSTLLLMCTSLIESFMKSYLRDSAKLNQRKGLRSFTTSSVKFKKLILKIDSADYGEIKPLFEHVIGIKLSKILNSKTLESISILF